MMKGTMRMVKSRGNRVVFMLPKRYLMKYIQSDCTPYEN